MTKQKWIVTGIATPTILTSVGLGFAAMSTNPPFIVLPWLPALFFVLAGLVTIGLMIYLTWSLLIRLRLQAPITIINQTGNMNNAVIGNKNIVSTTNKVKKSPPKRLTYDNVLWEEDRDSYGRMSAAGPFCPKDLTPLASKHGNNINTHVDAFDSITSYLRLFCLECKSEYLLIIGGSKRVFDSRNEVTNLFEGMRRREQELKNANLPSTPDKEGYQK